MNWAGSFLRADALPIAQSTVSKHCIQLGKSNTLYWYINWLPREEHYSNASSSTTAGDDAVSTLFVSGAGDVADAATDAVGNVVNAAVTHHNTRIILQWVLLITASALSSAILPNN